MASNEKKTPLKDIRGAGGLVKFKYTKDLGNREKDEEVPMHKSTAMALESQGFGVVGAKVKVSTANKK